MCFPDLLNKTITVRESQKKIQFPWYNSWFIKVSLLVGGGAALRIHAL